MTTKQSLLMLMLAAGSATLVMSGPVNAGSVSDTFKSIGNAIQTTARGGEGVTKQQNQTATPKLSNTGQGMEKSMNRRGR